MAQKRGLCYAISCPDDIHQTHQITSSFLTLSFDRDDVTYMWELADHSLRIEDQSTKEFMKVVCCNAPPSPLCEKIVGGEGRVLATGIWKFTSAPEWETATLSPPTSENLRSVFERIVRWRRTADSIFGWEVALFADLAKPLTVVATETTQI